MNIPIYKATIEPDINDEHEVNYIALVDRPAIESNFLKFNSNSERIMFAIANEEERIITGLAMVANMPIYRNENGFEYYVYFDAQTIKQIAEKFFKKKYNFNLNLDHNPNATTENIFFFESWIIDRAKGKLPMDEFSDVEDGSWIVSAKVEDPQIWEAIKRGEFKGFSVEGLFKVTRDNSVEIQEISDEQFAADLEFLLQYLNS
jgi:hypothetical protein